jgi:rSAM/selenodomain-associated transferase 1
VVFAKAPEPGQVKTRLIPILRAREAAELHEALLLDTLGVVESCAEVVIAFTPAMGRRSLERLLGGHRRLLPQGPGDLGDRLARVFEQLCEGGKPVLAVGSDCPGLTAAGIQAAAAALGRVDVVLGPALDGGYYLVGLRKPHPELFRNIPWSTSEVLEITRSRAAEAGLRVELLEPARDLDTPEDLFEWYAGSRSEDFGGGYPRTWRLLHAILPPRRFAALEEALGSRPER